MPRELKARTEPNKKRSPPNRSFWNTFKGNIFTKKDVKAITPCNPAESIDHPIIQHPQFMSDVREKRTDRHESMVINKQRFTQFKLPLKDRYEVLVTPEVLELCGGRKCLAKLWTFLEFMCQKSGHTFMASKAIATCMGFTETRFYQLQADLKKMGVVYTNNWQTRLGRMRILITRRTAPLAWHTWHCQRPVPEKEKARFIKWAFTSEKNIPSSPYLIWKDEWMRILLLHKKSLGTKGEIIKPSELRFDRAFNRKCTKLNVFNILGKRCLSSELRKKHTRPRNSYGKPIDYLLKMPQKTGKFKTGPPNWQNRKNPPKIRKKIDLDDATAVYDALTRGGLEGQNLQTAISALCVLRPELEKAYNPIGYLVEGARSGWLFGKVQDCYAEHRAQAGRKRALDLELNFY